MTFAHTVCSELLFTLAKSWKELEASTPSGRIMWLLRGELGNSTITLFGIRVFAGVIKISRREHLG